MENRELFRVENIYAEYDDSFVLKDLSFSMQKNEMAALLGANGTGKTTLMKCIAQRLTHKGRCQLSGAVLEQQSVKERAKHISYIPQRSTLSLSLPVLDVVLMGFNPQLKLLEQPSSTQREQALSALESLGLAHAAQNDYQSLSEGQKQLVYLARTLIEGSNLLLLDEPDSALDFQNRYLILRRLKQLVKEKEKCALLSLHDPQLALEFCEHLILLKEGKVFAELYPQTDDVSSMETALRQIYGPVQLEQHQDRQGKQHYIVLWEDEACIH